MSLLNKSSFQHYVFKKVLKSFFSLLVITLVVFFISIKGKINPIQNKINALFYNKEISVIEKNKIVEQYVKLSHSNLPLFYLSIEPWCFNDSVFSFYNPREQLFVQNLQYQFKNWTRVISYYHSIKKFGDALQDDNNVVILNNVNAIYQFKNPQDFKRLNHELLIIDTTNTSCYAKHKHLLLELIHKSSILLIEQESKLNFLPAAHLYAENQFHYWLFGFGKEEGLLQGSFGKSITNGESVNNIIVRNLTWSLLFSLFSILISLVVSILLGLYIASFKNKRMYDISLKFILLLYSIPNFCVCILCVTFFSSAHFFNVLPSSGLSFSLSNSDATFLELIPHLILPIICYCYVSTLFLTQYIAALAHKEYENDYVRTAIAKGLSNKTILRKHILKNCTVPIIQIIGLLFPYLVAGSIIIETFFTIPGLGFQTIHAILNYDYTLLAALIFISTLFTLTIYLLTDICIVFIDKRITLNTNV